VTTEDKYDLGRVVVTSFIVGTLIVLAIPWPYNLPFNVAFGVWYGWKIGKKRHDEKLTA
jgi:hypothetical protein